MTQRDGAKAHSVFDELVAVDVPDVAALAALNQERGLLGILIIALGVGMGTTGNQRVESLPQAVGFGEFHFGFS
jgi:hypothetical protein